MSIERPVPLHCYQPYSRLADRLGVSRQAIDKSLTRGTKVNGYFTIENKHRDEMTRADFMILIKYGLPASLVQQCVYFARAVAAIPPSVVDLVEGRLLRRMREGDDIGAAEIAEEYTRQNLARRGAWEEDDE